MPIGTQHRPGWEFSVRTWPSGKMPRNAS